MLFKKMILVMVFIFISTNTIYADDLSGTISGQKLVVCGNGKIVGNFNLTKEQGWFVKANMLFIFDPNNYPEPTNIPGYKVLERNESPNKSYLTKVFKFHGKKLILVGNNLSTRKQYIFHPVNLYKDDTLCHKIGTQLYNYYPDKLIFNCEFVPKTSSETKAKEFLNSIKRNDLNIALWYFSEECIGNNLRGVIADKNKKEKFCQKIYNLMKKNQDFVWNIEGRRDNKIEIFFPKNIDNKDSVGEIYFLFKNDKITQFMDFSDFVLN